MKKALALVMAGAMALSMVACGGGSTSTSTATSGSTAASTGTSTASGTATEITLWTYPIGSWQKEETVNGFIAEFNKQYPDIKVNVEYLDYTNGDDKVTTAIEAKNTPDIIFEGPERLVSNWGAKGLMVDLKDLLIEGTYDAPVKACTSPDGAVYEVPVCMIAHGMAINRDVFEEAGALQYLNEETLTWNSVEDFFKAVQAVYDAGYEFVGAVFCGGQGGDQGTRALVTNLGGGTYANAEHTEYTYASQGNAEALAKLYAQDGIVFDSSIVAADANQNFINGTFQMSFCWNINDEINNADALSFEVLPVAFPSDSTPILQGGIWGFGVFDNGDEAKIEAAKTFIKFMTEDNEQYTKTVVATNFTPVRDVEGYESVNTLLPKYAALTPMMGDYYQVTLGWAQARTEWWNMLQRVGSGDGSAESILAEMETAQTAANAAAAAG